MKRKVMLLMMAAMIFALPGCSGRRNDTQTGQENEESQYADALEVMNEVVKAYSEDELFAMYGGDQENAVMDAPGKFDISKTEELENVYALPAEQSSNIEDAASMVHMMNANTFTGIVYQLKDDTDMDAFVDSVESCIMAKQWICGQPDTLVVINVDDRYVITAFGAAELMEVFETNALSALSGAQVITEAPIV